MNIIIAFFTESNLITIFALAWLSIYFILTFWIFLYKYFSISHMIENEQESLNAILNDEQKLPRDVLFFNQNNITPSNGILCIWKNKLLKQATTGLSFLSIIASTSPFIGLFGTVVEILQAFGQLGNNGQVSFDIIAPVISKALIATAAGILTAIPAYTFFIALKRKAYDLGVYIQMQMDYLSPKQ